MTQPNPATPDRETEIRARVRAATPGPWELHEPWGPDFYAYLGGSHMRGVGTINFGTGEAAQADTAFVLKAREDVDWLLNRVAELKADREAAVAAEVRRALESAADDLEADARRLNGPVRSTTLTGAAYLIRCKAGTTAPTDGEQVQEEATTITPDRDGDGVTLHLPDFTRLDTQVWSVDIGLTKDGLDSLRDALCVPATPDSDESEELAEAAERRECYADAIQRRVVPGYKLTNILPEVYEAADAAIAVADEEWAGERADLEDEMRQREFQHEEDMGRLSILRDENSRLRNELEHRKEEVQRAYACLGWTYDGSDAGAVVSPARECTCGPVGDCRTEGPQQPDEDCPAHGNPAIISTTPATEAADALLDQRIAEALAQPRSPRA